MGQLCFGHPELITDQDYEAAAAEHVWRSELPWTHAATISTLRALMAGYLRRGRESFARAAAAVTAPTLVIWGTRDRLVDVRLSREAAAVFQQATLLVIAECGHVAQMEDPRTTARGILALWREVERPSRPVDSVTVPAEASSGGSRPDVAGAGSNDNPSGRAVRVLGAPYDNLVG